MFDVGFWELFLISVLALLLLGPEKLPKIVSKLGRWVGRARAMARSLRVQLEREVNMDEFKDEPGSPLSEDFMKAAKAIKDPLSEDFRKTAKAIKDPLSEDFRKAAKAIKDPLAKDND